MPPEEIREQESNGPTVEKEWDHNLETIPKQPKEQDMGNDDKKRQVPQEQSQMSLQVHFQNHSGVTWTMPNAKCSRAGPLATEKQQRGIPAPAATTR